MTDEDQPLTQEQKDKFVAWLNAKATNHNCPVCGVNDWFLGNHVIHAPIENTFTTGTVYPQVFISCNNCAFIRNFMAVQVGIVERDADESKTEQAVDG